MDCNGFFILALFAFLVHDQVPICIDSQIAFALYPSDTYYISVSVVLGKARLLRPIFDWDPRIYAHKVMPMNSNIPEWKSCARVGRIVKFILTV